MPASASAIALFALLLALTPGRTQSRPPASSATHDSHAESVVEPLDWFRRADRLTNLRLPGSQPFSMRVLFQSYPGLDFAPPGQSPLLTGPGIYQETWVSPEAWRREVSLGNYRAVEIRAGGKRTFQSSSPYEPSRITMLLQAVLAPIPRFILEPELDAHPTRWKLEHRTTGSIAWVSIRDRGQSQDSLLATVYDFLSSGILVRREGAYVTSWDDDQSFAERIVPRHITVQGIGLQGPVVTATVMIAPLAPSDRTIVQVLAEPADPGSTLEPIDFGSLENGGARAIHMEVPPPLPARYPASVEISATSVVDRSGTPRDAEIIGIRNEGGPLDQQTNGVVADIARAMVLALLKDRYHPALIDGKPCQVFSGMVEFPPRKQ